MKICICFEKPPKGAFIAGNRYEYTYIIDGKAVIDENGDGICFGSLKWFWYFKEIEEIK